MNTDIKVNLLKKTKINFVNAIAYIKILKNFFKMFKKINYLKVKL